VQFTADRVFRDKLERLQRLMSSQGAASLVAVLEAAVDEKLRLLESRRLGVGSRPRTKAAISGPPAKVATDGERTTAAAGGSLANAGVGGSDANAGASGARTEAAGSGSTEGAVTGPPTDLAAGAVTGPPTEPAAGGPRTNASIKSSPRRSRHVPVEVRRAVWERDEGRCAYHSESGRRCAERRGLQWHHRHPFGFGGEHSVANVALLCSSHNGYLAEIDYRRKGRDRRPRERGSRP
jgi:hypothetical protein